MGENTMFKSVLPSSRYRTDRVLKGSSKLMWMNRLSAGNPGTKERGFSFAEVLISLVITSFLLIGFLQLFDKQNMSYKVQGDLVVAQENLRMATETLVRDLRMTGYGLVDHTQALTATNNTSSPDQIAIRSASLFSPSYSLSSDYFCTPSATSISLGTGQGVNFQANDFFVIRGTKGEDMTRITQVNGDVLHMPTPLSTDYAMAATTVIHKVDTISFRVNGSNLERNVNNNGWQVLAENIEDLQLAYLPSNSNPTDSAAWLDSPASVLAVRMIRVSVMSRTSSQDPDLRNTGNNRRPGLEDRGQGGTPDGFRRRLLSSEVKLRNMYL